MAARQLPLALPPAGVPSEEDLRRAYELCHLAKPLDAVLADPAGRILLCNVARFTLRRPRLSRRAAR